MLDKFLNKTVIIRIKNDYISFSGIGILNSVDSFEHFSKHYILRTFCGDFEFAPDKIKKIKLVGDALVPKIYLDVLDDEGYE